MPDQIPTPQDVVLDALHSARLKAAKQSGNPKTVVPVPAVGVCIIINQGGPLLQVGDLDLVQATLDELVATSEYVRRVPMRAGNGYIIHPDAPLGRSAATDARSAFGGPCGRPTGGGEYVPRQWTHR
jgi:hypothetical protein